MIPRAAIMAGAASAAVAFGFAIGWGANGWRLGAGLERAKSEASQYRAEVLAEKAAASERVRKVEGDWNAKYQAALNAGRDRERVLRADLVAVRDAASGLRTQAAEAARRLAQSPAPAVLDYANTLGDVFAECSARYGEVAQAADGHASDARTILEAWPVNQE